MRCKNIKKTEKFITLGEILKSGLAKKNNSPIQDIESKKIVNKIKTTEKVIKKIPNDVQGI